MPRKPSAAEQKPQQAGHAEVTILALGLIISMPIINGRSTSGTTTVPSSCVVTGEEGGRITGCQASKQIRKKQDMH